MQCVGYCAVSTAGAGDWLCVCHLDTRDTYVYFVDSCSRNVANSGSCLNDIRDTAYFHLAGLRSANTGSLISNPIIADVALQYILYSQ